jgi:hypothetical protein
MPENQATRAHYKACRRATNWPEARYFAGKLGQEKEFEEADKEISGLSRKLEVGRYRAIQETVEALNRDLPGYRERALNYYLKHIRAPLRVERDVERAARRRDFDECIRLLQDLDRRTKWQVDDLDERCQQYRIEAQIEAFRRPVGLFRQVFELASGAVPALEELDGALGKAAALLGSPGSVAKIRDDLQLVRDTLENKQYARCARRLVDAHAPEGELKTDLSQQVEAMERLGEPSGSAAEREETEHELRTEFLDLLPQTMVLVAVPACRLLANVAFERLMQVEKVSAVASTSRARHMLDSVCSLLEGLTRLSYSEAGIEVPFPSPCLDLGWGVWRELEQFDEAGKLARNDYYQSVRQEKTAELEPLRQAWCKATAIQAVEHACWFAKKGDFDSGRNVLSRLEKMSGTELMHGVWPEFPGFAREYETLAQHVAQAEGHLKDKQFAQAYDALHADRDGMGERLAPTTLLKKHCYRACADKRRRRDDHAICCPSPGSSGSGGAHGSGNDRIDALVQQASKGRMDYGARRKELDALEDQVRRCLDGHWYWRAYRAAARLRKRSDKILDAKIFPKQEYGERRDRADQTLKHCRPRFLRAFVTGECLFYWVVHIVRGQTP